MPKKTSQPSALTYLKKLGSWLDENILLVFSALLIAFVPLYPKIPLFDILPGYIVRIRLEDALVAMAGLAWFIQLVRGKITWKTPLLKQIGTYLIVGLLSLVSAMLITHTVPLEALHIGKSTLHLLRYTEYFFLFFLTYDSIKNVNQAKVLIWTIIITVIGIAIYGVGQKYWYWPVYSTMNREFSKGVRLYLTEHARVQSTFGGHYDLGAYLVVVLPLLLSMAYKSGKKWERRFLYLSHGIGLWLLIVSASRAPFVAYSVAAAVVIGITAWEESTWKKRWKVFFKKGFALGLLTLVLFFSFGNDLYERFLHVLEGYPELSRTYHDWNYQRKQFRDELYYKLGISNTPPGGSVAFDNRDVMTPTDQQPTTVRPTDVYEDIPDIEKIVDENDNVIETREKPRVWSANALKYGLSVAIRLDSLWPNAIKGFTRNPLLGTGYATLNKEGSYHFTEADSTDNNFLRVLGETGLLGFVTFFAIIAVVMKQTKQHLFDKNKLSSSVAIGVFACSIGLLVNALYIDVYAASKVAFTYWAVVGLALAIFSFKPKKRKQPKKTVLL